MPQRALNIEPKCFYKWQKAALTPVAAACGAEFDPTTAAELRQLRPLNKQQAQELEILKKPSPFSQRPTHYESLPIHYGALCGLLGAPTLLGAGRYSQRVLRLPTSSVLSGKVRITRLGRGSDQGLWRI
jgi:hypothetical protein